MNRLNVTDIKIFGPAMNFSESLGFYKALGWQVNWQADENDLAELELANCRFYLQDFYNQDWANNFMMHIIVDDAKAWWQHASTVIARGNYKYARLREPKEQSYGALVTFVWDPSGVLLHFAEYLND